jgi:2',3'-cyclic-nucleotide 2'-phosphodiesterase (5'-nucleotidase family)
MKVKLILLFCTCFFFQTCTPSVKKINKLQGDDGKIEVVFLQLNDVYEIAPSDGGKIGGMARVATLLKKLERENPNTFCVLAGDFLNPSLIGQLKVDGQRIKGEQMVQVMNAIGVDFVTFGNHEFDIKQHELQARMNESDFVWLGTSVREVVDNQQVKFHKLKDGQKVEAVDNYILEVGDKDGTTARIGLFGTTIDSNPKKYVYYQDYYQRPIEEAQTLAVSCDAVIGLTHLEIDQDVELAKKMPVHVPLFMGGHDHDNMSVIAGNTVITKADANAKSAYIHRVTITNTKQGKTVDVNSELVKITDAIPEDPAVDALVDKWMKIQDELVEQIYPTPYEQIYTATEPWDARESSIRNFQTNFGSIMAKAMTAVGQNDVVGSFFNGGSVRIDDQLKGKIFAIDLFRALPFGGGVSEIKVKGSLLKKMLNQGQKNKGKGGFLQVDKFNYDESEKTWTAGNQKISDDGEYWIVVTSFLLTGLESGMDFFTMDNPEIVEVYVSPNKDDPRFDIRRVLIDYIKKMK